MIFACLLVLLLLLLSGVRISLCVFFVSTMLAVMINSLSVSGDEADRLHHGEFGFFALDFSDDVFVSQVEGKSVNEA